MQRADRIVRIINQAVRRWAIRAWVKSSAWMIRNSNLTRFPMPRKVVNSVLLPCLIELACTIESVPSPANLHIIGRRKRMGRVASPALNGC